MRNKILSIIAVMALTLGVSSCFGGDHGTGPGWTGSNCNDADECIVNFLLYTAQGWCDIDIDHQTSVGTGSNSSLPQKHGIDVDASDCSNSAQGQERIQWRGACTTTDSPTTDAVAASPSTLTWTGWDQFYWHGTVAGRESITCPSSHPYAWNTQVKVYNQVGVPSIFQFHITEGDSLKIQGAGLVIRESDSNPSRWNW